MGKECLPNRKRKKKLATVIGAEGLMGREAGQEGVKPGLAGSMVGASL